MTRIIYNSPSALGDAAVTDVKSPRTFSSKAAGIKKVGTYVPREAVGNATAADVKSGVTFSSSSVLGGVGTLVIGPGLGDIHQYGKGNVGTGTISSGQTKKLFLPSDSPLVTVSQYLYVFFYCYENDASAGYIMRYRGFWSYLTNTTYTQPAAGGPLLNVSFSGQQVNITNNAGQSFADIQADIVFVGTNGYGD